MVLIYKLALTLILNGSVSHYEFIVPDKVISVKVNNLTTISKE
jgi:hypothetical protein